MPDIKYFLGMTNGDAGRIFATSLTAGRLIACWHFASDVSGVVTAVPSSVDMFGIRIPIESVLRAGLESDAWAETDTVLLGSSAASAAAPAGIRNGATVVTPTTGGGIAALGGDLGALASAVAASGPVQTPVYLMNPVDLVRALTLSPGLNSDQVTLISSPYLPAKTVVFLDASNFASASRDEPEITVSREPTLVMRSPDPAPIVNAAGVSGIPTTSTWQIDAYAIRVILDLAWGVIPTRVATVSAITW